MQGFQPLPAQVDLPALEREVLARWQDLGIFERSLKQTAGGPAWIFYEGPPTANGMPGVHHVEARTFKDLFPRFKTMQGFHVPRQAGWDCHGLPVEVAVEKELGFTGKRDIEAYGVAEFNARCRESVLRYVDAWLDMSRRMGYWADTEHAYRTMDPSYIESVWWSLKVVYEAGLLVRDFRISPYCPRCGTPLSDAELGQPDVYQAVSDPAITVRFRLEALPEGAPPELADADLLVWTTTPWTLVSNTAVAVHPEATYVVAVSERTSERVVVAADLAERVLGDGWRVTATFPGVELVGARYHRPFGMIRIPDAHVVVPGSFVTTEDGTGLVHLAPAFGADDMDASRAHGLPVVNPIRPDGHFEDDVPLVGGLFFKDADGRLIEDLRDRGLLFRAERHEHSYPHCWRCGTPLMYYALPSWFIRTTAIKDRLLEQNERTNWYPATVKEGRYGEWLRNNVDWALSRTRYWGTPLPLWECGQSHVTPVGSLAELSELAGRDLRGLDPHRPYVDGVAFDCPSCGERARRVPEVIDVWYDSGSMPFAQHGAPWHDLAEFEAAYPAQFICEAIDQTRGWFYSLMAVGTLVFGRSSYENVVCLGLVLDEAGVKMSKHLGNALEPIPLMDAHGADALRWFFAASGSPWGDRRVGHEMLGEIVRKVLLTYWNTASFLVLYANAGGWTAEPGSASTVAERPLMDRWMLSELHLLVREVTASLESFDTAGAGRRIGAFIDDLSNWYVRRSRRRFWDGPGAPEGAAGFATLYECVTVLTLLMAPFTPFVTDYVWGVLRRSGAPESVHLASWPVADATLIDPELSSQMTLVRRLVDLGRSARSGASVRMRQPLRRALIGAAGFEGLPAELRAEIAAELNVAELDVLGGPLSGSGGAGELVDYEVKPNFRSLGRRFGARTPDVAAAITAIPAAEIATAVLSGGTVAVRVGSGSGSGSGSGDETVLVGADDVIVTQTPRAGWAVAADAGETVAIDVAIGPELRREGIAREVIRLVQEARKNDGLDVSDRIWLRWSSADPEVTTALAEHAGVIADEVLAVQYGPETSAAAGPGAGTGTGTVGVADLAVEHVDPDLGLTFWLGRA
ncbi:MAG TPA: isoleucine--tRNA ligase [Streptosporangiaceae bacterium]|nr:isoleucine--tRNA ligase [Streptosporangiaceae bacterium]